MRKAGINELKPVIEINCTKGDGSRSVRCFRAALPLRRNPVSMPFGSSGKFVPGLPIL